MKLHKLDLSNKKYKEATLERNAHLFHENDWDWVSLKQTLSESFIEKHKDKVNWFFISSYKNLSEEFIEKHIELCSLRQIFYCQELSEEFVRKHLKPEYLTYLLVNPNISKKIKKEIKLLKEII